MGVLTSAPGDLLLTVTEIEGIDGSPPRTMSFSEFELRPLSFELLKKAKLHQKIRIPFETNNAKITHTNINDIDPSHFISFKADLESHFTSQAIGLVPGGWLPSGLAAHRANTVVMLDRNIVSKVTDRFDAGVKKAREPDFIDVFGDFPVRLNPILFAMEGNAKSTPSPDLVKNQLDEAVRKLRRALPKANLLVGPGSVEAALAMIQATRPHMEQAESFLLQLAPLLKSPIGKRNFEARWNDVVHIADACGVDRSSLVFLAALSTVAIPNGGSPAKGVLNFKADYSAADAYNALADLRSLEMLMMFFAVYPNERMQLCTADRDLALFWTGILAHEFRREGDETLFTLSPLEGILPEEACIEYQKLTSVGWA
jgi:hypothetical protein